MLHLHECADPAPAKSVAEPLHSVGDSAAVEESVVEFLQSVIDSDAVADALTEISYS
jgi:hypothetical protein